MHYRVEVVLHLRRDEAAATNAGRAQRHLHYSRHRLIDIPESNHHPTITALIVAPKPGCKFGEDIFLVALYTSCKQHC